MERAAPAPAERQGGRPAAIAPAGPSSRRFSPVNFRDVTVTGAFWRERLDTVLTRTIPSQHEQLRENGILESLELRKPPPPLRIPVRAHGLTTQVFWDSDVGKWIEIASYGLSFRRDAAIERQIETIIDRLAAAQLPDGYLNCWYIGREIENRWTNLRDKHELYCAGHLLEGAIAYFDATGRRRLLDIMLRYVDHIAATFGTGAGQNQGYCGHPEIELALVKLYRVTGEREHLDLAAYFVDQRGAQPHYFDREARARGEDPARYYFKTYEYSQSHKPVREQDNVVGHAVRGMYLYAAMADLAAETEDGSLKEACERLWADVTSKRMYVTAGLGPSASNEGFTTDYDLPNATAYAETCASVALIFWAQRMLNLDCDSRYADVMELAFYNGALSGLSRDGTHYFYENPLESSGDHHRWTWHSCPCCPMNVARLIGSVGGYFYSVGENLLAVHMYGGNSANVTLAGRAVRVSQATEYPWSGDVTVMIEPEAPAEFELRLRVPRWAREATLTVNGERTEVPTVGGYLALHRRWSSGDQVRLSLPMPVERIHAHPDVKMDIGRVALKRGPLVYCLEGIDNGGGPLNRFRLPPNAALRCDALPGFLDGTVVVRAEADLADVGDWAGALYRAAPPSRRPAELTAIPYYLWDNREPGEMLVWIPE
jgi:DUF1680 family protein